MDLDLIKKVRKLLVLAKGTDNPNEAATAMKAATKLVEQHRLEMADIENEEGTAEAAVADQHPFFRAPKIEPWRRRMLTYLADANGCISYSWKQVHVASGKIFCCLGMVGRPTDIAIIRELYAYLMTELTRLYCRDRKLGAVDKNSWWLGAGHGVWDALEQGKKDARKQSTSTAIVLVDARKDEAQVVFKSSFKKVRTQTLREVKATRSSYDKGQIAGTQAMSQRGTQLEPARPTDKTSKGQLGFKFESSYNAPRRTS